MTHSIAETSIPQQQPASEIERRTPEPEHIENNLSEAKLRELAISDAMTYVYGGAHHRPPDPKHQPRARIIASAMTGTHDNLSGTITSVVSRKNGTIVVAESESPSLAADATAFGFERAMRASKTAEADIATAVGHVQQALTKSVPKVVKRARSYIKMESPDGEATATAVQIVDNKLVYDGQRPLFVYGPGGESTRLTYGRTQQRGVHVLDEGLNYIITSNGRISDEDVIKAKLDNVMQDALKEAKNPRTEKELEQLALQLQNALASDGSTGAIMVNAVDVAEWKDRRSKLAQKSDYIVRAPSTVAYWGLSKTTARGRQRREIYETDSQAGKVGRKAAAVGDVVGNVALMAAMYTIAVGTARMTGHDLPGLSHLSDLWTHHGTGTPATQHLPTGTQTHIIPPDTHAPAPPGPEVAPPPKILPPHTHAQSFPDSYTAHRRDPNTGRASSAWGISKLALQHAGHDAGLSNEQVNKLTNNYNLSRLVKAFLNDENNPNNIGALHDSKHFLDADKSYSTHAINALSKHITTQYTHRLGLDTSTAPVTSTHTGLTPVGPAAEPVPATPSTAETAVPSPLPTDGDATGAQAQGAPELPHESRASGTLIMLATVAVTGMAATWIHAAVRAGQNHSVRAELAIEPNPPMIHGKGRRYKQLKRAGVLRPDMVGTTLMEDTASYSIVERVKISRALRKQRRELNMADDGQ